MRTLFTLLFLLLAVTACEPDSTPEDAAATAEDSLAGDDMTDDMTGTMPDWNTVQDESDRVAVVEGFSGPEAVRYDPDQDVYFVSNFNGPPSGDANGFISRVSPEGIIDSLRFMTGTDAYPLHGPRGMYITGDTLWAADADGVHGFDRRSGAHVAFVDFTGFEPGFLNDITEGPDNTLYITDTGASRIYQLRGGEAGLVVEDTLLGPPNGITWDATGQRLLLAPWGGVQAFRAWVPDASELVDVGTSEGGNFDGIEIVGNRILVSSQLDSSLHVLENGVGRRLIKVPGAPADIGVDTQRNHVAVPYVDLDRVDIWALPPAQAQ